jgi:hypothetical protein
MFDKCWVAPLQTTNHAGVCFIHQATGDAIRILHVQLALAVIPTTVEVKVTTIISLHRSVSGELCVPHLAKLGVLWRRCTVVLAADSASNSPTYNRIVTLLHRASYLCIVLSIQV